MNFNLDHIHKLKNPDSSTHLSNEHIQVGVKIIHTSSRLLLFLSDILKPFKLTFQQYNVLRILQESPEPISIKFISDKMIDQNSNTSRLVDKLAKKGLAQRPKSKTDKRTVNVSLTPKGVDLVTVAKNSIATQFILKMTIFSENDLEQFNVILDRVNNNF